MVQLDEKNLLHYFNRLSIMIGPITDSCALFVGGCCRDPLLRVHPEARQGNASPHLRRDHAVHGSTLVNNASALPVVVMALIVGSVIGELVFAESFLAKCIRALIPPRKKQALRQ